MAESFAIDYVDGSGYTPSWAKGAGYHSVLMQCTEMIGDYSSDGNWCFEWTAYVLDQGVENFPQSTQGTTTPSSTHNVSERVCSENKICAIPGDYLKYKNFDTFDDFEEIAIVEFKEKVNENTIKFFSDGFGSKPLTYNLNLKTGIETHDEYTNVNRPFNFIEPIPMERGQDVYRIFGNYYETKIVAEMVSNLKEMGLMDIERTVVAAEINNGDDGTGGLAYDKETGVLLTQIEKYVLDGKEYTAGIVLIETNMFSVPTTIQFNANDIPVGFLDTGETEREEEITYEFTSKPEITTTQPKKQEVKAEITPKQTEKSIAESGLGAIGVAMATIILIGMPVLFVVLIVLKSKKRLPEGMFKKIMKIVGILFLALIVIGIIFAALI